ncbi:SAM-dependent methyltransferase, partial [Campylobacter coli]|nr:SAM-dependent methyltransferase [Campylobacter coli]
EKDIKQLYQGENYQIIDIKINTLKNLENNLSELYIIEGKKL